MNFESSENKNNVELFFGYTDPKVFKSELIEDLTSTIELQFLDEKKVSIEAFVSGVDRGSKKLFSETFDDGNVEVVLEQAKEGFFVRSLFNQVLANQEYDQEDFRQELSRYVGDESHQEIYRKISQKLLSKRENDQRIVEKDETVGDIFIRHAQIKGSEELGEQLNDVLNLVRAGKVDHNQFKGLSPVEGELQFSREISSVKLPFTDIVLLRDYPEWGRIDFSLLKRYHDHALYGDLFVGRSKDSRYLIVVNTRQLERGVSPSGVNGVIAHELQHVLRRLMDPAYERALNHRRRGEDSFELSKDTIEKLIIDEFTANLVGNDISFFHDSYLKPFLVELKEKIKTEDDHDSFDALESQVSELAELIEMAMNNELLGDKETYSAIFYGTMLSKNIAELVTNLKVMLSYIESLYED